MKNLFYILICLSLFLVGCNEDPPVKVEPLTTKAVFIANEGVFPQGKGTLSSFNPGTKQTAHNLFQKANTHHIGAVVNSVMVDGNRTFIVANADGVVYVINTDTQLIEAKFENLDSPRHVVKVGTDKYYLSDWGEQGVHVIDMKRRKIVGKVLPTGYGPENMVEHDGKVFIVNKGGFENGQAKKDSTVVVYDAVMDTLMATIEVGENPNSIQVDANGKIWVLSEGIVGDTPPASSTFGKLSIIDSDSLTVDTNLLMPSNEMRPKGLLISTNGQNLYFLDGEDEADVMKHSINSTTISSTSFITGTFYALGYDPTLRQIYVSNIVDDLTPGIISQYDENGSIVLSFSGGLRPGSFAFQTNR